MKKLPVIETFGPTIQGEGMVIGQKTMFVRVAGCDYACEWCDSKFTWDGSEKHNTSLLHPDEVLTELEEKAGNNFNHITISGGNPALYGEPMHRFVQLAHAKGYRVALETQGSIWQEWMKHIDELTLSPKPPSSFMKTNIDMLDYIVERLYQDGRNVSIKIVIFDETDLIYAKMLFARYRSYKIPYFISVGNNDVTTDGDISSQLLTQLSELFDHVLEDPELNDVKPLPQLHALVWGNKRGV